MGKYVLDGTQTILEYVHKGSCRQLFQAFVKVKSRQTKAFGEAVKLESWTPPCKIDL